jgi:ABC-2 type transport system permease protein
MRKVWAVIRREFVERVRNKWFLISTVLGPLFMLGIGVLPALLMTKSGRMNHIVILDASTGTLAERMRTQLTRSGRFSASILGTSDARIGAVEDSLAAAVREEVLDGYLALSSATVEAGSAEYRGRNVSSITDMAILEGALKQSVVVERLNRRGVDPAVVQEAQGRINLKTERISRQGKGGESGQASFFLGYGVGLILYMVILLYGINVMRSVIEEKQTRIIEILVSSLKPFQLMLGKVIGVGAVGMFQFSIWTLTGHLLVRNRTRILASFHVPAAAMNSMQMPNISGQLLAVAIAYFLLGYLLYSALFAVVGASCNTESEAQQAQQPVMMLLVGSLIVSFSALGDPSGPLAVGASLVPLSAPIIMPVRVATSDVAPAQIALSLAIMAATVLVVVWGAARVYRIGILMYGKRPNIKELLRWARQS